MSQRRQADLQRLQEQGKSRRLLRLRMTLALIIFLINAFVWIPVVALFLILVFAFFSEWLRLFKKLYPPKERLWRVHCLEVVPIS
jgi:Flp pilus assembly protein TadB